MAKDDNALNDYRNDFNDYKKVCSKIDSVKDNLSKAKVSAILRLVCN